MATPMDAAERARHAHRLQRARLALAKIKATPDRIYEDRASLRWRERMYAISEQEFPPIIVGNAEASPSLLIAHMKTLCLYQQLWVPQRWFYTLRYWANFRKVNVQPFDFRIRCVGEEARLIRMG